MRLITGATAKSNIEEFYSDINFRPIRFRVYDSNSSWNHKWSRVQWRALCTNITEVNLSAFSYRLFHDDFSSIVRAKFSQSVELLVFMYKILMVSVHYICLIVTMNDASQARYNFRNQPPTKVPWVHLESFKRSFIPPTSHLDLSTCPLVHKSLQPPCITDLQGSDTTWELRMPTSLLNNLPEKYFLKTTSVNNVKLLLYLDDNNLMWLINTASDGHLYIMRS